MSKVSKKSRRIAVGANKSRLKELSIFAVGAALLAPYAIAQDQEQDATPTNESAKSDEALTEILVTGIRKALQTSQEIKKESDTVVDSITASDIGSFPDKSVAEALQRMSGITVTRFAASGDTSHFSAEPSGVLVRGLPQVRSEFNGRDSFNANSSRGLSFGDVSPELMAGVDTYKNATADMIEGGIAGTVNLRTHTPFDSEGFVAAFSAELGYGSLAEEAAPAGSMLLSNRWDTGIGEFGVMLNAAYSEVITESQGVQLTRFFNASNVDAYGGGTKWIPGGVDIRNNTYTRTRTGGSFATQWRSPEESLQRDAAVQPFRVRQRLGRVFNQRRRGRFPAAAEPRPRFAFFAQSAKALPRMSSTAAVCSCAASSTTRQTAGWALTPSTAPDDCTSEWLSGLGLLHVERRHARLPEYARRRPQRRNAFLEADQYHRRLFAQPALGRHRARRPQLRHPEDRVIGRQLRQQRQQQDGRRRPSRHQRRQAGLQLHAAHGLRLDGGRLLRSAELVP